MSAKILVVDDIMLNRELIKQKLENQYYHVTLASNANEAFAILASQKIDLILLDVMMPGIDGFVACKKIKNNPISAHIPVIIITSLNDQSDKNKGLQSGADELLSKPINDIELLARVKSLTNKGSILDYLTIENNLKLSLLQDNVMLSITKDMTHNIALLDDDDDRTEDIIHIIKQKSYVIKKFKDIDSLIQSTDFIPDLLIINLTSNKFNGIKACVDIKCNEKLKLTSIIAIFDNNNNNLIIKALEAGINDYFIYPVNHEELQARVKTKLNNKHYEEYIISSFEEAMTLSIKDNLTGLFNRRYFVTHFKYLLANKKPSEQKDLYLIIFDLDNFKNINDIYGHHIGDEIIKIFATSTKLLFNQVANIISRIGGEEFCLIFQDDITNTNLINLLEELRSNFTENCLKYKDKNNIKPILKQHNIKNFVPTTSVGVAKFTPGDSYKSLFEKADKALYKAKNAGKNTIII